MAIEVEIEFLSQPLDHLNIRFQVADLISSWTYVPSICFLLLSLRILNRKLKDIPSFGFHMFELNIDMVLGIISFSSTDAMHIV